MIPPPSVTRLALDPGSSSCTRVAGAPEREAALDDGALIARQLESAGVAKEIWRVQQVDVQRVAGDLYRGGS
jgi:hypothetical protein